MAEAAGEELLGELQLPEGAVPESSEPAGGGWPLSSTADVPASGNLVDCHTWWTVPGNPEALEAFLKAHLPTGTTVLLWGSNSGYGVTQWVVGYRLPAVNDVLQFRELNVEFTALPDGRTGVRGDGLVIWLAPSSPSDAVPATAQVLDVEVKLAHQELTLVDQVTESVKVAAVAAMIDRMPLNPGVQCEGPEPPAEAKFTFRSALDGPVLAVASVPGEAEEQPGVCLPMTLHLPESDRTVELEDDAFIREVQTLLGVKIY